MKEAVLSPCQDGEAARSVSWEVCGLWQGVPVPEGLCEGRGLPQVGTAASAAPQPSRAAWGRCLRLCI